ncbi:site-specific integrase [Geothrix sp. PMB-07]|uniref:tyrosine-type recombinase/integrase n=1 Tax=Geothrix sp. PMB-07 TaxID=3068640 RepID=UPI002740D8CA|nr:site-specific integrase [Geothrix sp. PMB-07]WLT31136.1 site-specific integrase [Geothrix sp. PMB-07]
MSKAAGSWLARWNDPETKSEAQARIGTADDYSDADGVAVLTFAQAQAKAQEWFESRADEAILAREGVPRKKGPWTVADAMEAYFEDAERRGVKGLDRDKQRSALWIVPELGALEVAELTRRRIEAWQKRLTEAPKRKRTGKAGVKSHKKKPSKDDPPKPKPAPPQTEEEKRARKDTANRVLSTLKAALNHALDRGRVKHGEAWQAVKPYKGTTSARIRFLSAEEQVRLVNVCPADFRRLVKGALYTGARYGELCRLVVGDFNAANGSLFIAISKSGKSRHIVLTEEAQEFFTSITAGRPSDELMFLRDEVERRKRPELAGGWGASDQTRFMSLACKAAEVPKAAFHELRHTYASGLVNAGLPMAYVAAQLGHTDTRMTEKHYGHLAPTALADAIRTLAPKLGLGNDPKVTPLKIAVASE